MPGAVQLLVVAPAGKENRKNTLEHSIESFKISLSLAPAALLAQRRIAPLSRWVGAPGAQLAPLPGVRELPVRVLLQPLHLPPGEKLRLRLALPLLRLCRSLCPVALPVNIVQGDGKKKTN